MIVMWHKFEYLEGDKLNVINSYMISIGDDKDNTGMAKTVGLPVSLAAKLVLDKNILLTGIQIPVTREIYAPILAGLQPYGIEIKEENPREIKMPDRTL